MHFGIALLSEQSLWLLRRRARDILIKVRADHVDTLGKLVMDKLRTIEGVENTLSCVVYETVKETTDILA